MVVGILILCAFSFFFFFFYNGMGRENGAG